MDELLLSRFVGGDADEAEIARLSGALRSDPAAIDELFAVAELERDLVRVLKPARRRRSVLLIGLAAAALLAAAIYLLLPEAAIRVERADGIALKVGDPVPVGSVLRGSAVLRYPDGSRLEFRGTLGVEEGNALTLTRGELKADVAPQKTPMLLRTPHGEATVLGTRFTLTAAPGATRLEVEEGRVRMTRDGASADVGAGQCVLVAKGAPFAVSPSGWQALPGTAARKVAPAPSPNVQGVSGAGAVVAAWSGAAYDARRDRLVLWGGGYSDYHGNELYAFDLRALAWERLTDPTAEPKLGRDANEDGTPNSRATYNGLAYDAGRDRFFSFGGVVAGGTSGGGPWTFDFDRKAWSFETASGPRPEGGAGGACGYADGRLWWAGGSGLYSLADGRWTRHSDEGAYYQTGAMDPKRGRWVLLGEGKLRTVDLKSGRISPWATTGGAAILAKSNPGFDYDPVRDRFVAWGGGPVYLLDPDTAKWTARELPGAPSATPNGLFGRFRYSPYLDAFVVVTAFDGPVHLIRP